MHRAWILLVTLLSLAPLAAAQDEEFVLYHSDNVEASGFVQHLKLPHYVDFQSELELIRRMREHISTVVVRYKGRVDGWDVVNELQRRQGTAERDYPPLIATTADVQKGSRERLLGEGLDDFLAKPVDSEALDEIITRWTAGPDADS